MEDEAARFGAAVGLDSVSTFESIVDGADHYFMEMNTRIQVEHRVTELCYALEFVNPDDDEDVVRVDSLIEAMTLIARHGAALPKPRRVVRHADSLEVRLNATNDALAPFAGGQIESWSDCSPIEIRDDQGISLRNPDTGFFMPYYLAGAYDSNIALLLTHGETRAETYRNMLEVLRETRLAGTNLETNLDFLYGIVNWLVAQNPRAKIETRFVSAYLAAAGRLSADAQQVDLDAAYAHMKHKSTEMFTDPEVSAGYARAMDLKASMILRPLKALFARPHGLAGWTAVSARYLEILNGEIRWLANPVDVLHELYRFLNMSEPEGAAAETIWDHDLEILERARAFYARLQTGLSPASYGALNAMLREPNCPTGAPDAFREAWQGLRAEHLGYQHGLQILALPQHIARETGFHQLRVRPDMTVEIPADLLDGELQAKMRKVLAPPPFASPDEIVAEYRGMFFPREAPGMPRYLEAGTHFEVGDPLYVIEVMKMFTKVHATFAGTVDELLMQDQEGLVVRQGEVLFKVTPDERDEPIDQVEMDQRGRERTRFLAESCLQVA
jgi:biotin carboxyl carrier protein